MLNWATTVRRNGARWLSANPLKGIDRRPKKNPRRPVTCQERFDATRRAIQARAAQAAAGSVERFRWIRLQLALVLAEATGRRIGALRQLTWEDVDYASPSITWRADADKMGVLWTIDLEASSIAGLRQFQGRLSGIGGWVFPSARFPDQPMDRWAMVKWLLVAEADAGLPKLVGGVWHPYRRKWAMERKQWPIRDVAAVGGWKSIRSLVECYAQSDREPYAPSSTNRENCSQRTWNRRSSRRESCGRLRGANQQAEGVAGGNGNGPTRQAAPTFSHEPWGGGPDGAQSGTRVRKSSTATT